MWTDQLGVLTPPDPLAPPPAAPAGTLLRPGRNAWRVERASRALVLSNGADYFGALRRTLLRARRSVQIIGWDIDSRTRLVGESGEPEDTLPATLGAFLAALVERRPELSVKLLLWDYSVLYALERELLPALKLHWNTPPQVELCLDDSAPIGASHHQKIVVVDDAVAFSGGLDLTIRRWDTAAHEPGDPRRVDPAGKPYPPFHDVQMMVEGPAAAALGELARERWAEAACESLPPAPPADRSPWPEELEPDFRDVALGIARTRPGRDDRPAIEEVEALFLDTIDAAERHLFIENQFLTNATIARRLIRRLRQAPALEVLILAPRTHHTWLEHRTMLAGRIRFMQLIREAGLGERVQLLFPHVRGLGTGASEVMVHAKVTVADDRLLRVGSANICNRSMGTDTECDLAVEAPPGPAGAATRAAITRVRDRLLAEHLGTTPDKLAAAIAAAGGSLFAGVAALNRGRHRLRPVQDGELKDGEGFPGIEAAADPERPIEAGEFLADFARADTPRGLGPLLLRAALVLVPMAALMLLWRYTPLAGLLQPQALQATLHSGGAFGPLLAVGLFLLLGFLAFPVNVLILGTAAAFGTWPGLLYAAGGALVSAAATYAAGRRLGPGLLRQWLGPRINRVSQQVNRNGILAVTVVRLMPIAPFTLVNLVAGAMRIRFTDYMAGTALGLLPGILLLSALGDRLFHILDNPSLLNIAVLTGLVLLWAGVTWGLQKLVSRFRRQA